MKFPFWLLVVFLLLSPAFCFGQQHNFRKYNVEDGLGQSQVYAMMQDDQGRIWMGTRGGGISIFNGFEFSTINNSDGLSSNYINDIVIDSDGRVWIATNSGVTIYDGKQYSILRFPEKGGNAVNDINIDDSTTIYFATGAGIYKLELDKDSLDPVLITQETINASSICPDNGMLWIGTDEGLLQLNKNRLIRMADRSHYMRNAITRLEKDKKGNLWIGTYGDGLYCYNKKDFFRIDLAKELYRQTILDIYIDDRDNLWLATLRSGVVNYDRSSRIFNFITEQEGLSNNHTRCIIQDNNRNFWFGTSGGGVCQYLGKQFTFLDQRHKLGGNFIYSVMRDSNGKLWVGNSQKGVSVLAPGEEVLRFDGSNEFANVKVKSMTEDAEGNIWLGTDGNGVFIYKNEQFEAINELRGTYIKQIIRGNDNDVWIATAGNGLIRIHQKGNNYLIEKWTKDDGILSNRLTSLKFDNKGRLWYATEGSGIGCFYNNQNIRKITKEDGIASDQIRSLIIDLDGYLWIGTAGEGISRIDMTDNEVQVKNISIANGLSSGNIYLLTFDGSGNLIAGSEKGLDHILFNADASVKQIRHYGKQDGFIGVETCQNAVWNDKNGSIWFGTINGLCQFNPSQLSENKEAPILSLNDVKLFYESILPTHPNLLARGKPTERLVFDYSNNHLTFDFIGIDLKRPEEVTYKWKMEGFDEEWSPPSRDRSILYSNLNPGKYSFLLLASNEDGVWSSEPLRFDFEIKEPYWMAAWFQISIGVGIFLLFLIAYIWTVSRMRKKVKARQRQVELDKQMLELEQKALRLQMNPHFIFNALNSIQSLIGTGKETEARYFLAKFSRLMRQILNNSRTSEITLKEEIETLENYLLVERFANGDRFSYEIEADEDLETDFIKIPPMLLQPFIENSIKHGMQGKAADDHTGLIRVSFREREGFLECIIEDNGIGRKKAGELKEQSMETYHESMSLLVTRERLQMLEPDEDHRSLEILDLYDKQENALGTKVIIRIPIE